MTDARLPGYWLTELRFADLTDRQWRIFTNALMWSAEQGTDGHIPTKYLRWLHDEGVDESDLDVLEAAGLFERTESGIAMPRWSDDKGLRQSTAATVESYRTRKRENQAAYRQRVSGRSESGHVTGHVNGNVGEGPMDEISMGASAYVTGNVTDHVTGNALRRNCDAHPDGWQQPCRACGEARKRADANRSPRQSRCERSGHEYAESGYCLHCAQHEEDAA